MNLLWSELYRPKSFEELDFHFETNQNLKNLSQSSSLPHIIFYGPNGSGKYTRLMCMLSNIFGRGVYQINTDQFQATIKGKSF